MAEGETPTPAAEPKVPTIKPGLSAAAAMKVARKFGKIVGELKDARKLNTELQNQLSKAPKAEDYAKLQKDVTARNHRDVFNKEARKAGIPENRLDAAWKLAGHNAEGEPDEKAIKSLVDSTIEANDFLKPAAAAEAEGEGGNEETTTTTATTPEPKLGKGPGANKGAADREVGGFTATAAQVANPAWMATNQAKIAEHSKAGTFKILG